ncbi:MAG: glucose-6-phosphate isomerase [Planctomycetes bacterium]|nr:glucose-6-phosphate isomerase [Planctomycetota bacterium]
MADAPTITLDLANLTADKVGEHGLPAADVIALESRITAYRRQLATERAAGKHAYIGLADDEAMLESVLRVTQPRLGRFKHLVLLGIGGSSLGLKALVQALQADGAELHVVDNTDPTLFASVRNAVELKHSLFVPVSKSGGTIETVAALGYFAGELKKAGLALGDHMLAVTDPENGYLRAFADKHDIPTADIPPAVGGRFSVLSAAGLAPAALMNVDIAALLEGAARTAELCTNGNRADDWPAQLGMLAAQMYLQRGKTSMVVMPYSSRLESVSDWFVQLWDESLGKDGKGQAAIPAVGATDQHAQLQLFLEGPNDKLLLFMRLARHTPDIKLGEFEWDSFGAGYVQGKTLGEIFNAQHAGTAQACVERGRPNVTLSLPRLDAGTLGELLMGLEIATTYAGHALGVNPYDQPAVELGKKISRKMLGG